MTSSDNPTISQQSDDPVVPAPAEIAHLFGQLEVLEMVGWGGMGVVYKARQKSLERLVALKLLLPRSGQHAIFTERFSREARALARLEHPSIITIHDFGQAEPYWYFVMEFVDGPNLRQLIERGPVESVHALQIAAQVCDALQYAHDEGVLHRDIKPENVLLNARGRVRIADFGLAKLMSDRPSTSMMLTRPQQAMGTMHYMAPEQIEGAAEVDQRADLYALGVMLYELLTGELPIGRFPPPSELIQVDPRIDEIVLRALEKKPDRRYQRAMDFRTDVMSIVSSPEAQRDSSASFAGHPPVAGAISASQSSHQSSFGASSGASHGSAPGSTHGSSHGSSHLTPRQMKKAGYQMLPADYPGRVQTGTAYLVWFLMFVGVGGVHRLYCGKIISGVLWLLTGGCFFIGQLIDLMLIPDMVRQTNLRRAYEYDRVLRSQGIAPPQMPPSSHR